MNIHYIFTKFSWIFILFTWYSYFFRETGVLQWDRCWYSWGKNYIKKFFKNL